MAKTAFELQCSGVFEKRSNQDPKLTFNRNQNTGVQYPSMFSYHTGDEDTLLEYSGKTSEEECKCNCTKTCWLKIPDALLLLSLSTLWSSTGVCPRPDALSAVRVASWEHYQTP